MGIRFTVLTPIIVPAILIDIMGYMWTVKLFYNHALHTYLAELAIYIMMFS